MKKLNKKGFTLAELLIVIAIIAVLIAIAIPVFAGQLDNARRQTDHANMRNAYALAQVATLEGKINIGGTDTPINGTTEKTCYYSKTGTLVESGNEYVCKADGESASCAESLLCTTVTDHKTGAKIKITYGNNKATASLEAPTP